MDPMTPSQAIAERDALAEDEQAAFDDAEELRAALTNLLDALAWWSDGASWEWNARSKMGRAMRRARRAVGGTR